MRKLLLTSAILFGTAMTAHATNLAGEIWQGTPSGGDLTLPASGEHAFFGVNGLSGSADAAIPATYTPNGFLGAFTGFTGFYGATPGFDPNALLSTSGATSGTNVGTRIHLTGNIALTPGLNTFSVTHDDGTVTNINGINVLNSPGPTSPEMQTFAYNNAANAASASLSLDYGECCEGPAILQTNMQSVAPSSVPEPSVLAILGFGLVGISLVRARRPAMRRIARS